MASVEDDEKLMLATGAHLRIIGMNRVIAHIHGETDEREQPTDGPLPHSADALLS